MKLGPLVALRLALRILRLAGAELAEVLGCLGHDILEELKRYAAEGRPYLLSLRYPTTTGEFHEAERDPQPYRRTSKGYVEEDATSFVSLVNRLPAKPAGRGRPCDNNSSSSITGTDWSYEAHGCVCTARSMTYPPQHTTDGGGRREEPLGL